MKVATRAWVRKAEADYRAARKLARGREQFPDQVCFSCQQTSEKYLKALLEELALPVPKTHDLDELLKRLTPHYAGLRRIRRGLTFLSNFAVASRYPGYNATRRQAESAWRWAGRVRSMCRELLGIT